MCLGCYGNEVLGKVRLQGPAHSLRLQSPEATIPEAAITRGYNSRGCNHPRLQSPEATTPEATITRGYNSRGCNHPRLQFPRLQSPEAAIPNGTIYPKTSSLR